MNTIEKLNLLDKKTEIQMLSSNRNIESKKDEKLMDACEQFESLFIKQMLNTMRKTIHKEENPLYGGLAEDIFEDMLYDEYALQMAKTTNLGIAEMLYKQMSKLG